MNVFKNCEQDQSPNNIPSPSPVAQPFINKLGTTPKKIPNKEKNNASAYSLKNFNNLWNQTSVGAFGGNQIDSKNSKRNNVPVKNMIISPNLIRTTPKPSNIKMSNSSNVIKLEANQSSVDV